MENHSAEEPKEEQSHIDNSAGGETNNNNDNAPTEEDIQGKIFIGGLSWQTTEETLRFYFEKFGELADVAIMSDKKTGKPRYVKII
jgi:RNA recognition motif-containing protein